MERPIAAKDPILSPRAGVVNPLTSKTDIAVDAAAAAPAILPEKSNRLRVLAVLSALMGFASISTDLYLPALPTMAQALRSNAGAMELTISGYLIGFSLGQLFWGPISDRYGRRFPVAIGLVIFVIGSGGCALATSAEQIIIWRIVQGLGACAAVVIARAMLRDLYEGARAAQMMSILMTVMAIAPLVAPFMGGQILAFATWRAIFWTLAVVGAGTLAALFILPETLPPERRNREKLGRAFADYRMLLGEPRVIGYIGAGAFFYAGLFAYIAGTPFAYITYYHVPSAWYGLLFGAAIVGIMTTNLLNARLVTRFGMVGMLRAGAAGTALAGLALALTALTGWDGLIGLAVPLLVFVSLAGFIVANSISGALASFPNRAGAVSALVGALQYGAGILGSGLVGAFADGTPRPMACIIAVFGLGCALCAWLFVRERAPVSTERL